jgi:hypothetical protein
MDGDREDEVGQGDDGRSTGARSDSGAQDTYLTKLVRVLGWKGPILLSAVLLATAVRSALPRFARWGPTAMAAAGLLILGVLWRRRAPSVQVRTDVVGLALAAVLAAAGGLRTAGVVEPWWLYGGLAGVVLLAVIVDYWWSDERSVSGEWRKRDLRVPEILKVDLTGMVAAESLLIYAILLGSGWSDFANSPYFGGLLFYFGASIFAIAAGYTEIARESSRSRQDYGLHEFLLETLIDLQGVDDRTLQRDLARNLRSVAERLEGARIPSIVNDDDGPVPVVLPTDDPIKLYQGRSAEGLVAALAAEDLTGYAVTDEGDVYLARNGSLVKHYADGTWHTEAGELDAEAERALLYATPHGLLNLVDGVTPPEYGDRDTGPSSDGEDVTFDALVEEVTATDDETEKPFSVGGRDVDLREMFDRADDFIRRLTEK